MASSFGAHYKALMKKNYTIWKRNSCGSCCEVVVPILLSLLFIVFRSSLSKENIAEISYVNKSSKILAAAPSTPAEMDAFNMINCWERSEQDSPTFRLGHVALMPKNSITAQLRSIMSGYTSPKGNKFSFSEFDSLDQFNQYITGDNYKEDICFGVEVRQNGLDFATQLMFNTTEKMTSDIPDTLTAEEIEYKPQNKEAFYDPYIRYGSLQIKNWVDNAIFKVVSGNNAAKISVDISPLKMKAYTSDTIADIMKGNMATFLVLPLIVVFLRMTSAILTEKENKIREGMKIMGMKDSSFYLSWVSWYMIIYTIISLVVSFILKISIFQNSNWLLIFIWHWLYCMSLIAQSFFISTFFTNAKLGNIVAMVFYLFMYMFQFILASSSTVAESTNTGISIISQSNLSIAADVFLLVETEGSGISWSRCWKNVNNFRVGTSLLMFLLNCFVFMILALYFDQVIPNDFGKKKHPLFCFDWICKRRNESQFHAIDKNEDSESMKQNMEEVPAGLRLQEQQGQALKIDNIYRLYSNGKKAVNGVSLSMYKNQIFCLLGHNGAGKTSTIQMLTGMLEFSAGSANVFGKDVNSEMDEIRKFMGVCPQHDILFPDVSVKEHLELFAAFKGMESQDIPAAVNQAIQDVDLGEKTNELSKNLSGGQKRRLSVAIAFIGGSKLIYLDEPTSGMDTSARRHIWDMLKRYKNDKIIVLTTHFMDEADFLGDRIGIMGEGKLICCGSSVFLKNRFGVGYNLTIVKQNTDVESKPIIDLVKKFVPDGNKISDVSQEIAFQLPISSVSQFENLFSTFDEKKAQLKISTYGISITTLEEVFLKVAHINSAGNQNHVQKSAAEHTAKVVPSEDGSAKDMKLPITNNRQGHHNNNNNNKSKKDIDNFDLNSVRIKNPLKLFFSHYNAIIVKRLLYFGRDKRGFICEVFLPCVMVVVGLSLLLISFLSDSPEFAVLSDVYGKNDLYYGGEAAVSPTSQSALMGFLTSSIVAANVASTNILDWDKKSFEDVKLERKGAYWFTNINQSGLDYSYYTQVQTITRSSPLYFTNEMNQAIIRHATSQKVNMKISNHPLRLTKKTLQGKGSAAGIVASFMFSIGFSFIPASLITFVVKERVGMVKHQHLVSGVSLLSYWGANFTIDIIKHLVPAIFSILMVLAYSIETYTKHSSDFAAASLLFFLYGWGIIPFCYLTSFIFEDYGGAQVTNFFIHFVFGGIAPLTIFILRLIQSTRNVGLFLGWVFRFIPSFAFGYGILNIGSRSTYAQTDLLTEPYGTYQMNIAGGDILFLSLGGIFYFLMVFLYEKMSNRKGLSELISGESKIQYKSKEYDDDVQREMDTVAKSSPSDYTVRVKDLRKVFVPAKDRVKVAVDRVSFGIKQGEVFTLLGVNGAGKTTTFKVLSGEIQPTSGEAHIAGYSVQNELEDARTNIGYCPQFDALLENLTAREHLNLYSAIKGIPAHLRDGLVEKKLIEMDLKKFEGILAGTFSGGNKRKLSVAIAMLGQPSIVFLDEPSTGMDPAARRFMWDVISRISTVNKSSSVILTTHSMEEAEALSTRVAIQVEGTLQCIGTIQEIKNKFGKGYEVEIKIHKPTIVEIQNQAKAAGFQSIGQKIQMNQLKIALQKLQCPELLPTIAEGQSGEILFKDLNSSKGLSLELLMEYVFIEKAGNNIMQFISEKFGGFDIIEHFADFYRFRIETAVSIGKVFGHFEKNKAQLFISEYSLKQATIEQIFNMFAEGKIGVNEHLKKNLARKDSFQKSKQQNIPSRPQIYSKEVEINSNSYEKSTKRYEGNDIEMQYNPMNQTGGHLIQGFQKNQHI